MNRFIEDNNGKKITKGIKETENKPELDLIPAEVILEMGKILTLGKKKYPRRNWELGNDYGKYFGALQRHLWKWWNGENFDEETGENHLSHALCCLSFLLTYQKRGIGNDDRPWKKLISKN